RLRHRRRPRPEGNYGGKDASLARSCGSLRNNSYALRLCTTVHMKYRTILEHFEGALLYVEEGSREPRDRLVERQARVSFYCIAQRASGGLDPAPEKDALRGEVVLLPGDEVAHRVAQRRDMVFGLGSVLPACQPQGGQLAAQLGERRFAGVSDGIRARVKCYGRLAGADEHRVVLVAHRLFIRLSGS